MAERIRVGIVGAGGNTRARHIPGLRAIEGVEVVSVANRTLESSRRAAQELNIPTAYGNWLDLVEADDTDAIVIGTWPYMHAPVTLATLAAGKHVLCEARMAMNAAEARRMLEEARARPDLVAQVVPAPFTLAVDRTIQRLLAEGYVGDLLAVEMTVTRPEFFDREARLTWRQNADLSGLNALTMGIWYESLMRWVGPASRVLANTRVFVPRRLDAEGTPRTVTIPDHIDVVADLACGAAATMRFSAVTGLGERSDVYLFGSEGTIHYDGLSGALRGGRRGAEGLAPLDVPAEMRGDWRVEEEFVNAIRGLEEVRLTRFEDGVRYMEFTEAVALSAQTGRAVALPLSPERR
jgi:predicted dehydrogenase